MSRPPFLVDFFPNRAEFPDVCRKLWDTLKKRHRELYLRLLAVLEAIGEEGPNIRGHGIETFEGPIRNIHVGGYTFPIRLYFVAGKQNRVWVLWICVKKAQRLPHRDAEQVRKRAKEARER
ncbi:MAG: type II toxin-antitoxin system RelE/ParE family toxin [Candidatus Riflebacteria bacterium]|nr:type II toxin-antitoxin system RelE/ParE family toxin [Candidatus Riflebacteria bacterium]